jgi:malonyl-CoA O-methyltransferase
MLGVAAGKPALAGRLVQADALALPLRSESADLAICSFALGYIADLSGAIAEMARVTKRGGTVVVSDLHPLAVAAGWTRSFRVDGALYEIAHFTRSAAQLQNGMRLAGLEPELQIDQRFEDPERAIFLAAGKGGVFAEVSGIPAVWIGIWKKP